MHAVRFSCGDASPEERLNWRRNLLCSTARRSSRVGGRRSGVRDVIIVALITVADRLCRRSQDLRQVGHVKGRGNQANDGGACDGRGLRVRARSRSIRDDTAQLDLAVVGTVTEIGKRVSETTSNDDIERLFRFIISNERGSLSYSTASLGSEAFVNRENKLAAKGRPNADA